MSTTVEPFNIFQAVLKDDRNALKYLIEEEEVPVNSITKDRQTAAHIAAKEGRLSVLRYLISKDPTLVKAMDVFGDTPFFVAIKKGNLEVVKYLSEMCKVNPSQPNYRVHGNTAVHIAAEVGQLGILKYLVKERYGDVNTKNDLGEPPVFLATGKKHLDIVKFLTEETDVDLTITGNMRDNVLFMSARNGDVTIPKYLLDEQELNFDVNQKDKLGRSIVFLAAGLHHLNFIEYLVGEKGADVNTADYLGRTALHQAAGTSNVKIVKYLIEKGANPLLKDHNGKTAKQTAGDQNMKKYLEKQEQQRHSRTQRSVDKFPPILLPLLSKTILENSVNGIEGPTVTSVGCVSSSIIESFLSLSGVWLQSSRKLRVQPSFSLIVPEIIQKKVDPLAIAAIIEEPQIR